MSRHTHLMIYGLTCMGRTHLSVLAIYLNRKSLYLFRRGRSEVLVPLQQTLAESSLIRSRLHSRKGHLTL